MSRSMVLLFPLMAAGMIAQTSAPALPSTQDALNANLAAANAAKDAEQQIKAAEPVIAAANAAIKDAEQQIKVAEPDLRLKQ